MTTRDCKRVVMSIRVAIRSSNEFLTVVDGRLD